MDGWKIKYDKWDTADQPLRETLFAQGNGYFVTRGAAEELRTGEYHYPGTYLAGGYNRLKSEIAGRVVENEDLVNWPNWLYLAFRIEDGKWFHLSDVNVLAYEHELDLKRGIVQRRIRFCDHAHRLTSLTGTRIVHMDNRNLAALELRIKPENWSGKVYVRAGLDGTVTNSGVRRYQSLNGSHLEILNKGRADEDIIYLSVQTVQSKIRMTQAARIRIYENEKELSSKKLFQDEGGMVLMETAFHCEKKHEVRIEKIVSLYTSRDQAISEEESQAIAAVRRSGVFSSLCKTHQQAWSRLWHRCDIRLVNQNHYGQSILRLHIFHLLQTASFNSIEWDMGIPARGWHGEAYRGHIFWDELFIFPFLNLRIPELARALLLYRYRRLEQAGYAAKKAGYQGAMFPWQSGSDGREESQIIHLNPKSGEWKEDNTHLQHHVNAAIAHNVCQYYEATHDVEFMSYYGMELLLNISRFLASLTHFNKKEDRFEIHHVVGPDEFHTAYPDSEEPGLDNNAYTNIMTAWVLKNTLINLDILAEDRKNELLKITGILKEDLRLWDEISRKMFVPFMDDLIISQFEGYEKLSEFDWTGYREKYGNIERLDRILGAEEDSPNRYKAGKQADVLMLFYLFSAEELVDLFSHMNIKFDAEKMIPANIEYYSKRCSFGSSLSRLVYSWILARADREASWKHFLKALDVDFKDTQNGTTREGIHLGAMAGTVDMVQRCYTGLEIRDDVLWINPVLPDELSRICMRIRYRGHWICMEFETGYIKVSIEKGLSSKVKIGYKNHIYNMSPGEEKCLKPE